MPVTLERAQAAKQAARLRLAHLSGIVGIGITRVGEDYAVKINLRDAHDAGAVPPEIDGVPVRVEVVGSIRAR